MHKTALVVLDGLGLAQDLEASAITPTTMPFLHHLMQRHGCAQLQASGTAVGLDADQAGNSEVGHLTIGAGRVLETTLTRIRRAFVRGEWGRHPLWRTLHKQPRVHVAGLLSDAGVHAHVTSLMQTVQLALHAGARSVSLHLFLDGVDSPSGTAIEYLRDLDTLLRIYPQVGVASVSGRRWACDRSGDAAIADHCVLGMRGEQRQLPYSIEAVAAHLAAGGNESTFPFHYGSGAPLQPGDPVILTHHRADRTRQLAAALSKVARVYSLIDLGGAVPADHVFFPVASIAGGLVDTLQAHGVEMMRIAESCKFPHVTFFLNGMRAMDGAAIEIPSIPEEQIQHHPEMSLADLATAVLKQMRDPSQRALAVNIPNLDQTGHTGNLALARRAAECVDQALRDIYACAIEQDWNLVLTADHGNADRMRDAQGRPVGSHSANPVPLIVVDAQNVLGLRAGAGGTIAQVAPSFLSLCRLVPPAHMESSLVETIKGVIHETH